MRFYPILLSSLIQLFFKLSQHCRSSFIQLINERLTSAKSVSFICLLNLQLTWNCIIVIYAHFRICSIRRLKSMSNRLILENMIFGQACVDDIFDGNVAVMEKRKQCNNATGVILSSCHTIITVIPIHCFGFKSSSNSSMAYGWHRISAPCLDNCVIKL